MRVVCVGNQKGGVGKTSVTVCLGGALADRGKRVLVLDLDPQGSASHWLGVPDDGKALLDVFTGKLELFEAVQDTRFERLSVVPAGPWLANADRMLSGEPGSEGSLRASLKGLPDRWDWVLIDTPPSWGFLPLASLVAAREVLIPVEPSPLALGGLAAFLDTIQKVRRLNSKLRVLGILPCRVAAYLRIQEEALEALRKRFGSQVLKTSIRATTKMAWSAAAGVPVGRLQGARTHPVVGDFNDLASEVIRRTP